MTIYRRIQLIAGIYLLIYIAALYFSTGVHIGFKLDSKSAHWVCELWAVAGCNYGVRGLAND
jgi:hypothetical protein